MGDITTFSANKREKLGKGASRALRNEGKIPAIIYGQKKEEVSISLDSKAIHKQYEQGSFTAKIFDLDVDGSSVKVLPKDIQLHPVTDKALHVDFLRVDDDSEVDVLVKVIFLNRETCPGIKRGGVLSIAKRKIELTCRADSIPEKIELDLAKLQIGESIHSSDVSYPEGVKPTITDRDFTIAVIVGKKAEKEAVEETESETEETTEE